ncbi:MAG: FkbM family methyltransferase [Psychroserpens sp.]|jgi:FkbM family methyltransferase
MRILLLFERIIKFIKTFNLSKNTFGSIFNSTYSINSTEVAIGITHYCSDIETIIDVGANKGQFAVAIKKAFPNAHIYCFEPIESEFEKLSKNLAKFTNVTLFNIALGETVSSAEFNLNQYSLSSSFLNVTEEHTDEKPITAQWRKVEIEISTLNKLVSNDDVRIQGKTLLKIDVQGFEEKVLRGSDKVLNLVDLIVLECSFIPLYENELLFQEMHELLGSYGFFLRAPLSFWQRRNLKIIQTDLLYERK